MQAAQVPVAHERGQRAVAAGAAGGRLDEELVDGGEVALRPVQQGCTGFVLGGRRLVAVRLIHTTTMRHPATAKQTIQRSRNWRTSGCNERSVSGLVGWPSERPDGRSTAGCRSA